MHKSIICGMDVIDITSSDSENETVVVSGPSGSQSKLSSNAGPGTTQFMVPACHVSVGREHSMPSDVNKPSNSCSPVEKRIPMMGISDAKCGSHLEDNGRDDSRFDKWSFPQPRHIEHEELDSRSASNGIGLALSDMELIKQGLGLPDFIPTNLQRNSSISSPPNNAPRNQHTDQRTLPRSLQPSWPKSRTQDSQVKTTNNYDDVSRMSDGNMVASTSHNNSVESNNADLDDIDEIIVLDGISLPESYTGKNTTNSHSTYHVDNGKQHRAMGTSSEVGSRQNQNNALRRCFPPRMSGNNLPGRYPPSFQRFDLSGNQDFPRVAEQANVQHDERLIYEAAVQDLAQSKCEIDLPSGLLSVPLLKHQKIALAWLDQKEMSGLPCSGGILGDDQGLGKTVSMIALIQKQMPLQKKFMSNQSCKITSETLNLDEDDKTSVTGNIGGKDPPESSSTVNKVVPMFIKGRPAAGTLVVCPASILRQWAYELDEKVTNNAKLSVLIYHGGARTKSTYDLAKYDVVLTTYAIIVNEVPKKPLAGDDDVEQRNSEEYVLSSEFSNDKKRKAASGSSNKKKKKGKSPLLDLDGGPLAGVRWFRVVLDEAQVIKNHRTQVARACCGLRAKRRWCLSGTPLQNTIDDIYSYFRFLKYEPYATFSCFSSSIKAPILRNAETGYKKLQAILKTVMLRRTKGTIIDGKPILNLPPKSILLKKLSFTQEERQFYEELEAVFRERFKRFAAEGTVKQNYASILLMLLRLRQACGHPLLVKDYQINSASKTSVGTAMKLPKEKLIQLLNELEIVVDCGLCHDTPEDAVITLCGHVFCYQCISENLAGDENLCPASGCRSNLVEDSIFSKGTLKSCMPNTHELAFIPSTSMAAENFTRWQDKYTSSKIVAALEILKSVRDSCTMFLGASPEGHNIIPSAEDIYETTSDTSDGMFNTVTSASLQHKFPPKAIVFSQWTGMLDLIEGPLNFSFIQYRRLDGSMSLASRERAIKDFYTDPEVTVMLMSLKAGNLGLNMIAACHIILLDLWWNPASEDQAIDRAHRIGQSKSVTVHRLTIENTVEERILQLQETKRKLISSAFGEDLSGRPGTRLTVEDLRFLFHV